MNIGTLVATLTVDTSGLMAAQGAMRTFEKTTISSMNAVSQKIRTVGYLTSAVLTLPILAVGKASFKMAEDFEYNMQKIVGLVGVAQNVVTEWGDAILKLGPQVGKGPKELSDAMFYIASAGIRGVEAMDVLKSSAMAATAGLGSVKDVANLVTSALNAYRGTGLNAAKATDILVEAVRVGKIEADGFASAIGPIIPIAAHLGVRWIRLQVQWQL